MCLSFRIPYSTCTVNNGVLCILITGTRIIQTPPGVRVRVLLLHVFVALHHKMFYGCYRRSIPCIIRCSTQCALVAILVYDTSSSMMLFEHDVSIMYYSSSCFVESFVLLIQSPSRRQGSSTNELHCIFVRYLQPTFAPQIKHISTASTALLKRKCCSSCFFVSNLTHG